LFSNSYGIVLFILLLGCKRLIVLWWSWKSIAVVLDNGGVVTGYSGGTGIRRARG
jgi:hypothetical protein